MKFRLVNQDIIPERILRSGIHGPSEIFENLKTKIIENFFSDRVVRQNDNVKDKDANQIV